MEREIADIKSTLLEHSKILIKLDHTICGDERASVDGYGKRIKTIESYIEKDKRFKWSLAGGLAVLTAIFNWIFK